jgi:Predicted methyltransferase (contains TPR repeat)
MLPRLEHRPMELCLQALMDSASRPFLSSGICDWQFARGKLRYDPVYLAVLRKGLLPDQGRLLDLGCGQGILLALLGAARQQYEAGHWPVGWPAPPLNLQLHGIDLRLKMVRTARLALDRKTSLEVLDLRVAELRPSRVIVLLDVLHYMEADAQWRLLEKAARALEPKGVLLLRVGDAGGGFAFFVTRLAERIAALARAQFRQHFHYRSAAKWVALLEDLGFAVGVEPMSAGTPFANVLIVACLTEASAYAR